MYLNDMVRGDMGVVLKVFVIVYFLFWLDFFMFYVKFINILIVLLFFCVVIS